MRDHRYRRLVDAAVLDQVLHLVVLPRLAGFGNDQDIVVADILIGYATLRTPVLHPPARRMAAKQDHLLRVYGLHDDLRDLPQLLLLVLR